MRDLVRAGHAAPSGARTTAPVQPSEEKP